MLIKNITSYAEYLNYESQYKFIIVYITADACQPCKIIKPKVNNFISVINKDDIIFLVLKNTVYEKNFEEFDKIFEIEAVPHFAFIENKHLLDSFVSSDFLFISMKIYNFIKLIENHSIVPKEGSENNDTIIENNDSNASDKTKVD